MSSNLGKSSDIAKAIKAGVNNTGSLLRLKKNKSVFVQQGDRINGNPSWYEKVPVEDYSMGSMRRTLRDSYYGQAVRRLNTGTVRSRNRGTSRH